MGIETALIAAAIGLGGAGAVASGIGGAKQASAQRGAAWQTQYGGNTGMGYNKIPAAPPNALFPEMQKQYISSLEALSPIMQNTMGEMAATGSPTDVGPAFESLKAAMGRQVGEGRANVAEQFASSGLANSSSMMTGLVDYESQTNKDFMSILSQYTMQAQEAAAGRRLQAGSILSGMYSTPAMAFSPSEYIAPVNASSAGAGGGWSAAAASMGGLSETMMMMLLLNQMGGGKMLGTH